MQLWNTEWNVWMKMSIPPIFCPNPPRTSTDISPIFCPSGHCTALQPGSSWAPLAPEKWLPRWTGKKWWQRSTRDLYLPYFCTKARRARGTGEKDRGRGADKSRNRNYAEFILCKFTKSFPERTADSIGLRTGKASKSASKSSLSVRARGAAGVVMCPRAQPVVNWALRAADCKWRTTGPSTAHEWTTLKSASFFPCFLFLQVHSWTPFTHPNLFKSQKLQSKRMKIFKRSPEQGRFHVFFFFFCNRVAKSKGGRGPTGN